MPIPKVPTSSLVSMFYGMFGLHALAECARAGTMGAACNLEKDAFETIQLLQLMADTTCQGPAAAAAFYCISAASAFIAIWTKKNNPEVSLQTFLLSVALLFIGHSGEYGGIAQYYDENESDENAESLANGNGAAAAFTFIGFFVVLLTTLFGARLGKSALAVGMFFGIAFFGMAWTASAGAYADSYCDKNRKDQADLYETSCNGYTFATIMAMLSAICALVGCLCAKVAADTSKTTWMCWQMFFCFLLLSYTGYFGTDADNFCNNYNGVTDEDVAATYGVDVDLYCDGYGAATTFFLFGTLMSGVAIPLAYQGRKRGNIGLFFFSWAMMGLAFCSAYGSISNSNCNPPDNLNPDYEGITDKQCNGYGIASFLFVLVFLLGLVAIACCANADFDSTADGGSDAGAAGGEVPQDGSSYEGNKRGQV